MIEISWRKIGKKPKNFIKSKRQNTEDYGGNPSKNKTTKRQTIQNKKQNLSINHR